MPAHKRRIPFVPVTIRMDEDLWTDLRVLLCDSRTGSPRYGTWSASLNRALREWADSQKVSA